MLTTLRIYNIFFRNSTLREKPCGTIPSLQFGSRAAKACDAKSPGTNKLSKSKTFKQMKTQKMSLANIKGKLSRAEMKQIMAGSGPICSVSCGSGYYACCCSGNCTCKGLEDKTDYGCTSGGTGSSSCSAS